MIFFFNDWAVKNGFIEPVLTLMALAVGFTIIGMIVFINGGSFLRRQRGNELESPLSLSDQKRNTERRDQSLCLVFKIQ